MHDDIEIRLADRNDMAAEVFDVFMIERPRLNTPLTKTCVIMIIEDKLCRVGSQEIFRVDALCSSEER
jgi:hypothetical protein